MLYRLRRVLVALTFLSLVVQAQATTYYTATSGNDSNSCGTAQNRGTPKRSINGGVSCLSAGDTLLVVAGTYTDVVVWYYYGHQRSGSPGAPITIKSETYRGAIVQPGPAGMGQGLGGGRNIFGFENQSYWTLDGFVTDGTGMTEVLHVVAAQTANHISILNMEMRYGKCYTSGNNTTGITTDFGQDSWTIRGNYIHHMGTGAVAGQPFYSYGVYFTATNSLIENNEFAYASGHGMHMHNTLSSASGNIMRNNLIHHNGIPSNGNSPGVLWAAGGYNNAMYNNVIYANSGSAVRLGGAGSYGADNTVSHNTIVGNGSECIIVGSGYGNDRAHIQNNICYQNGNNTIVFNNSSGNTSDHNLLATNPNPATLFVNAGGGNYDLAPGSPAINAGATGTGITTDFNGADRGSAPDAGAYEFGGGGPPPAPTALSFSQEASTAGVGYPMRPAVTVRVLDQSGQLFPTASNPITLALTTNPTGATLGGTLTVTPIGGIATFSTLTVSLPADGYGLTASASGLTSDVGAPFTVLTGSPSVFYISLPSGSPAGSDSRTCTAALTVSTPLATFAKGLTCLVVPGSTLRARNGAYPETIDTLTQLIMSGTSSTPTTIGAYPGETVSLKPSGAFGTPLIFVRNADAYLTFDNIDLDGSLSTFLNGFVTYPGTHHIVYQHGDIKQTYYEPVFLQGNALKVLDTTVHDITVFDAAQKFPAVGVNAAADDITLDHLTISNIWGTGIQMDTPSGAITNAHITNSILHDTGQDGVSPALDVGHGTFDLTTNLLYTNRAGIRVRTGSSATQIVYTTLSGSTATGIQVDAGATNTVVKDVIVASAGTQITNAGTGTTFVTNLCSIAGTGCTVTGAPLFTNAGANDYTLQSGSPARNAGTAVAGVTLDLGGLPRISGVASDIGAYEYQETVVAVPRATLLAFQ